MFFTVLPTFFITEQFSIEFMVQLVKWWDTSETFSLVVCRAWFRFRWNNSVLNFYTQSECLPQRFLIILLLYSLKFIDSSQSFPIGGRELHESSKNSEQTCGLWYRWQKHAHCACTIYEMLHRTVALPAINLLFNLRQGALTQNILELKLRKCTMAKWS